MSGVTSKDGESGTWSVEENTTRVSYLVDITAGVEPEGGVIAEVSIEEGLPALAFDLISILLRLIWKSGSLCGVLFPSSHASVTSVFTSKILVLPLRFSFFVFFNFLPEEDLGSFEISIFYSVFGSKIGFGLSILSFGISNVLSFVVSIVFGISYFCSIILGLHFVISGRSALFPH